ncbi:MAG TPA: nucleotidyltransferase [Gammaproteobacteria bacterium]|nr:nucleotidyltransferase [Gammaproteobacteria bacterium]
MASSELQPPLIQALADVVAWTKAAKIPVVIVGGVAASLLGRARLTRDIDALVRLPESLWQKAVVRAAEYGLLPRIEEPVAFARRSRVLLLKHEPTEIDIDVMLSILPFEFAAIDNGRMTRIGGLEVNLPRVEDLLVMKAIAHRPRDLLDVEGLIDAHPDADLSDVRKWVREFSNAATMPELLADFDRIVAQRLRK